MLEYVEEDGDARIGTQTEFGILLIVKEVYVIKSIREYVYVFRQQL